MSDLINQKPLSADIVRLFSNYSETDMLSDSVLADEFHVEERSIRRWREERLLPPVGRGPLKMTMVGNLKVWFDARFDLMRQRALAEMKRLDDIGK